MIAHPENKAAAVDRWNYVLDGMVKEGWLTTSERAEADVPDAEAAGEARPGCPASAATWWRPSTTTSPSNKIIDEDTLKHGGGYRITTTIQKSKQHAFAKAVDDQLMSQLDKKNRKVDNYVRAGGVSIDPKTGKVLAMYGGIDYTKQYVQQRHPPRLPGRLHLQALRVHLGRPERLDHPGRHARSPRTRSTTAPTSAPWRAGPARRTPPRTRTRSTTAAITVREATDKSVNSVYAQMAVDVGPQKVERTAIDLGVPESTPDLNPYPSIALGTATASVLDMAEAYATLANHGEHGTYTLVAKITKDGEQIDLPARNAKQASPARPPTPPRPSCGASSRAARPQPRWRRAARRPARPAPPRRTRRPGSPATPPTSPPSSPSWARTPTPASTSPCTAPWVWRASTAAAHPLRSGPSSRGPPSTGSPVQDFDLHLQEGADVIYTPPSAPTDEPLTPGHQNPGTTTGGEATGGQTPGSTPGTAPGTLGGTPPTTNSTTDDGGTGDTGGTTDSSPTDTGNPTNSDTGGNSGGPGTPDSGDTPAATGPLSDNGT